MYGRYTKTNSFYFRGSFLTMYLLNAPKYAIENYLTNDIQAVYGIILMPASILSLFAQFIIAPLTNELTNLYKENQLQKMRKLENKISYMIIGFGIVAMLCGYLFGVPILNIIYRVDLAGYTMVLVFILFSYIMYAIGFTKTVILTIYRKLKEQFLVYLASAITAFVSSQYLIRSKRRRWNCSILFYHYVYILPNVYTPYQISIL